MTTEIMLVPLELSLPLLLEEPTHSKSLKHSGIVNHAHSKPSHNNLPTSPLFSLYAQTESIDDLLAGLLVAGQYLKREGAPISETDRDVPLRCWKTSTSFLSIPHTLE